MAVGKHHHDLRTGLQAVLRQELRLEGASLDWLPQENIFFRGANARTTTRVLQGNWLGADCGAIKPVTARSLGR